MIAEIMDNYWFPLGVTLFGVTLMVCHYVLGHTLFERNIIREIERYNLRKIDFELPICFERSNIVCTYKVGDSHIGILSRSNVVTASNDYYLVVISNINLESDCVYGVDYAERFGFEYENFDYLSSLDISVPLREKSLKCAITREGSIFLFYEMTGGYKKQINNLVMYLSEIKKIDINEN